MRPNVHGVKMRKYVFVLILLSVQAFAVDKKTIVPEKIMSKQDFRQYDNMMDWINNSPKLTTMLEDNRILGNGTFTSVTGFDCNRDGEIDDAMDCANIYKHLLEYYAEK
jgi:hypothetical protein